MGRVTFFTLSVITSCRAIICAGLRAKKETAGFATNLKIPVVNVRLRLSFTPYAQQIFYTTLKLDRHYLFIFLPKCIV